MLATVPTQVTVYDLHRSATQRTQKQRESFEEVLSRCYASIKRMARMHQTRCTFIVPHILFGKPVFDVNACIAFMIRNLTGNGFFVKCPPHNPRVLHISWDLKGPRPSSAHEALAAAAMASSNDPFAIPVPVSMPLSPTKNPSLSLSRPQPKRRTAPPASVGGKKETNTVRDEPPLSLVDFPFPVSFGRGNEKRSSVGDSPHLVGSSPGPDPDEKREKKSRTRGKKKQEKEKEKEQEQEQEEEQERQTTSPPAAAFDLPLPTRDGIFSPPTMFQRSISQFKPSGKFSLRL